MFHVKHHDLPGREQVNEACRSLGVVPPDDFHGKLSIYLDLLRDCSVRMNLVGPRERERLWGRHALESVSYGAHLQNEHVVDVGTGAGFPGFILALLGYSVTMVEPREKRCGFLETAARECGAVAEVLCSRVEESGPFPQGTQFTSRAVKKPEEMLSLLRGSASGDFTLLIRVSQREMNLQGNHRFFRLPVPPLDREGFLLQYSHSCLQD